MHRARFALAATVAITAFCAAEARAQQQSQAPAPPMTSVLAGKKLTPPIKGQADVEYTAPVTKREKVRGEDMVVTRFMVKNASPAPIGRLSIAETWYDKSGAVLTGGKGVINGLLQPGEVQTIVIETPWKAGMANQPMYNFAHTNGTVKPKRVPKLEAPKEPATTPAAAKK